MRKAASQARGFFRDMHETIHALFDTFHLTVFQAQAGPKFMPIESRLALLALTPTEC